MLSEAEPAAAWFCWADGVVGGVRGSSSPRSSSSAVSGVQDCGARGGGDSDVRCRLFCFPLALAEADFDDGAEFFDADCVPVAAFCFLLLGWYLYCGWTRLWRTRRRSASRWNGSFSSSVRILQKREDYCP